MILELSDFYLITTAKENHIINFFLIESKFPRRMSQFEPEQGQSGVIVPLYSPDPENDISQVTPNQGIQEESVLNLLPLQIQESCLLKDENFSSKKEDPDHTSEEGNDPERFHGEKPKTANKAFGRISDFLSFFKNRNSQINKFDTRFEKMQKTEKEDPHLAKEILNRKIRPLLYDSFAKMPLKYKTLYCQETKLVTSAQENIERGNQTKQKELKNFEKKLEKYTEMFKEDFCSLQEFYKKLLYAYTFTSFLYKRVNEFLRNEDWVSLDGLLLYTYCLFKAFLGFEASESFEFLQSEPKLDDKLLLFRGSAFDQESIDFYRSGKTKHFSWNSVTSTSLVKSRTARFMEQEEKRPILIIIEVDFKDLKSKDLNALYLANLSKIPGEKEVALAPGSIFELVDIQEVKGEKHEVEMRLRLVTNAKTLAHRGLFLHGMLQAVMRNAHEFKVVFLKEKELSRAIKHCKGNELIKDLEFCLCNFNKITIEILLDVLPTMSNLESFRINAVTLEKDCHLDQLVECLKKIKIVNFDILNSFSQDHQIKSVLESNCYWDCLRKLRISFDDDALVSSQTIKGSCNLSVNYLNPGCVFQLNTADGWSMLIKGLQKNDFENELENILSQKFSLARLKGKGENKHWEVQDEKNFERFTREIGGASVTGRLNTQFFFMESNFQAGERSLWEILETKFCSRSEKSPLRDLVNLSMKFVSPSNIIDFESQKKFCEAFQHLKSLENLQMSFDGYEDMTDEVLINISRNGIQHLQSLTHLYLSFDLCSKITDEGVRNLSIKAIQYLKLLSTLDLSFDRCGNITDEGIRSLSIEAIQHLKLLTTLRLRFNEYQNITEDGFKSLTCDGIKHLVSLTTLHLSFDRCNNITDEVLASLGESLEHLKLLKVLYLSFDVCGKVTDKGLKTLSDGGIKHLESLKALYLSFNVCSDITDRGLKSLISKGIQHFKQLSALYLSFDWCSKMTDVGLRSLSSEGIQYLTSLKKLCLSFNGCNEMTDIGLRILSRRGIKYLKSLTTLHLNFNVCYKMTDDEFRTLSREGIRNLKLLTDLHLSFDGCFNITEKGLAILTYDGLNYLYSLTRLHLSFNMCNKIQEESVRCLSHRGMQHLKSLTAFYLSFDGSENITDRLGWGDAFIQRVDRNPCFDFFSFSDIAIEKAGIELINRPKFENLGGALILCQGQFGFKVEEISSESDDRPPSSELPKYVHHLNEALYLENLRQLHLRFPPCEAITDLHLSELTVQTIACLKSLNKLDITLEECTQITDVGLANLFREGIQHLHLLTALSINFSKCGQITNKGLESLCIDGFRHLKRITALKLSFNECSKITDEGLRFLWGDGIQCLESLNSLFISALNTGVTEEIEKAFEILSLKSVVFLINKRTEEGKLGSCNLKRLNANIPERETDDQAKKTIDEKVPLDVVLCKRPTFNYQNKLHILNKNTLELMLIAEENKKLESLELSFDSCEGILDRLLNALLDDGINLKESVSTLNLKFKKCSEITSKWIGRLFSEGIQHLKSLTMLNLSFDECENLIDEEFKALSCERMKQLTSLHLSFNKCYNVADAGLEFAISFAIQHCQSLTTFDLCFDECRGITNEGLKKLSSKGIQHLKSLTSLHLSFDACKNIRDEGLKSLGLDGLQHLKLLEVLYLRFDRCENITSDGLRGLGFEGIQHLNTLKVLNLRFDRCENISSEGVQGLTYEGIEHLKSLTTLHLSFGNCYNFTNKVLRSVSENGMQHLKSLTTLYLRFDGYQNITDEGLKSLSLGGIQHLEKLTTLQLNFNNCEKITGEGLKSLSCQGILNLKLLTTLHLSFDGCKSIQKWGLICLLHEGIQHLQLLTALYLSFNAIPSFTDQVMKTLTFESLQYLKLLEIFELRVVWCKNVSDEGLKWLSSGIKRLTSLTSLYLSFNDCDKITDYGLNSLSWGLEPLKSLTFLHLSFNKCFGLTNKGLENLSYGIQNLKELITLNLNFNNCKNITNTGVENFSQIGLENLKSVDISFGRCERITSKALETFLLGGVYQLCGPSPPLISARRISLSLSQRRNTNAANIICENQIGFCLANTTSEEVLLSSLLDKHFTEKNKAINRITFQFEDASQITDDDFYNVYFQPNEASVLEELETLHFSLENCNQMTNEGIKLLCRGGMISFKSLRVLHLSFAQCNKITDRALESLCSQVIKFLELLHELQLNFSECTEITDKGLRILCYDGIQNLNDLTTLGLNFDGCSQLTSEGLKTLVSQGISKLRYLADLRLSFSRCPKIPDLILQSFLKILSYFDFKKYQTRFKSISI